MLIKRFLENIENQHLLIPENKVLLAVSGGIDSMVMAWLFHQSPYRFTIAHCNFQLRGKESDEDAIFVKKFAEDLGVGYFEKSFPTAEIVKTTGKSVQVTARELRYEWFEQVITKNDFDCYATAHHFDDQAETFFINLFRGTGVSGLRGIRAKNGKCIRPLLFATRNEISEFAGINQIPFRSDSSNESDKYLRNKIRHYILPAIESSFPGYRKGFEKTFEVFSGQELALQNEIGKITADVTECCGDHVKIHIDKILDLYPIEIYMFGILNPYNFNFPTIKNICKSLENQSGKKFISPTHVLIRDRLDFILTPRQLTSSDTGREFTISLTDERITAPITLHLEYKKNDPPHKIIPDTGIAQLDLNKLSFPLIIRKWRKGDTFYPLGMNTKKKLSDFFIDQKLSLQEKENTWLLVSRDDIVWVVGRRIDDRFKITPGTRNILIISRM